MYLKKLAVLIFTLFLVIDSYGQCAMCKAVVENGDSSMAEGVNNGITYLMAFPYILIGCLLYALYRYKKQPKN